MERDRGFWWGLNEQYRQVYSGSRKRGGRNSRERKRKSRELKSRNYSWNDYPSGKKKKLPGEKRKNSVMLKPPNDCVQSTFSAVRKFLGGRGQGKNGNWGGKGITL